MSWKRPIVVLALALAMAGAILLERFVINPGERERPDKAGRLFPELRESGVEVAYLRVTIREGKKLEFKRDRDGARWRMTKPLSLLAETSAVDRIADAFERMEVGPHEEPVRAEKGAPLKLKEYGLLPPDFEAEAETGDGIVYRIQVGAKIPLGRGKLYVRKPGEDVVYLVEDDLRTALDKEFRDFRDKHVLDFAKGRVERVEMTEPLGRVTLVRRPAPEDEPEEKDPEEEEPEKKRVFLEGWDLAEPVADHAKMGESDRVLDRLEWLEVVPLEGFVEDEYDGKDLARFGFDAPTRSYALFLSRGEGEEPEKRTLLVGKAVSGRPHQRYAWRSGTPFVVAVAEKKFEEINPGLEKLREKHLLGFTSGQVTKLTVEYASGEKPLVLKRVEEEPEDGHGEPEKTWQLHSPVRLEADKGQVEDLLRELARAEVESFHADGVEPGELEKKGLGERPEFKLTIEREKEPKLVMRFGREIKEGHKYLVFARRPAFPNALTVSRKIADLLRSTPLDLRSRQVWSFDGSGYNRLVLERRRGKHDPAPVRYEIEKDEEGQWHLVSPVKEQATRGVCDEIVARCADLKVRRFVGENADAKTLAGYGLEPPALRIELAQVGVEGTARRLVRLSAQDERSRIAKGVVEDAKGPTGLVWEIEDWHARPLFGDPIRKKMLDFAKEDMRRVEVSLRRGRTTYTLERRGEAWKVTKPKEQFLDPDALDAFLGALDYVVAERVEKAKAEPADLRRFGLGERAASRFKVTLADETVRELEVSASEADNQGNRFARTPDRESVFVISRDKAEKLARTLKDLGASDTPIVKEEEIPAWAPPRVEIRTGRGAFTIELFQDDAPNTVANFITLVEKKFYDGLAFHRVEDWVVQGGDAGPDKPGYTLPFEHRRNMKEHDYGAVGLALLPGDPNSGNSQFYVVKKREGAHHLDTKYVVFGRVMGAGMEVVERIQKGDKILFARVVHKPTGRTYEVKNKLEPRKP